MTPVWEESMGKMVKSIMGFVDGVVTSLQPTMEVLGDAFGKQKTLWLNSSVQPLSCLQLGGR